MSKSKFLEFVAKNPPPCLPGDKLYWYDVETGAIKVDKHPISQIVLDKNWEWKIVDEDSADRELITPNENEYFCLTPEDAKKFRDQVKSIEYTVLENEDSSVVVKKGIFSDIETMGMDEDFLDAILRVDTDIENGMAIELFGTIYGICQTLNN